MFFYQDKSYQISIEQRFHISDFEINEYHWSLTVTKNQK